MSIINFILIVIIGLVSANFMLKSTEEKDVFLRYIGSIEKRISALDEKLDERIMAVQDMQESDYQNAMNSLYNLSNDINRAKMRLARIEQENIKKDIQKNTGNFEAEIAPAIIARIDEIEKREDGSYGFIKR